MTFGSRMQIIDLYGRPSVAAPLDLAETLTARRGGHQGTARAG
jgi:hypothetical protein